MRVLVLVLFLVAAVLSGAGCGDSRPTEPEKSKASVKDRLQKAKGGARP
jgi:hypothetical protein